MGKATSIRNTIAAVALAGTAFTVPQLPVLAQTKVPPLEQQLAVATAKRDYIFAAQKGDTEGMAQAHAQAEEARKNGADLGSDMSLAEVVKSLQDRYDFKRPATLGQVLPNNWHISPAGQQISVGHFPTHGVLSPDGRYLLVSNNGQASQDLAVLDTTNNTVASSAPVKQTFIGLAFAKSGDTVYASGANDKTVLVFSFKDGVLTPAGTIPIGNYVGSLAVLKDGRVAVAELQADKVALVDPASKKVTQEIPVGRVPYWVSSSPDGSALYVSNWGSDSVSVVDPGAGKETAQIKVGKAPEAIAFSPSGDRMYVANTNADNVTAIDPKTNKVVKTYDVHFGGLPTGSTPTGLTVSPDGNRLYVTLASVNAVAELDTATGKAAGYIPTAWYPTDVLLHPANHELMILSGKGLGTGPNEHFGQPNQPKSQYVFAQIQGTVAVLSDPDATELKQMTNQVLVNSLAVVAHLSPAPDGNPVPGEAGGKSPIKHVFFIVRENRTYDQVLGDLPQGNGDPALTMFGRGVTPNAHALAEQFATLDNFYADAEVSTQGHAVVTGSYSTDVREKLTPALYSGRFPHDDLNNSVPYADPPAGYIWKNLAAYGVPFKIYGESNYPRTALYRSLVSLYGEDDALVKGFYANLRASKVLDDKINNGLMDRFAALGAKQDPQTLADYFAKDPAAAADLSTILTGDTKLAQRMATDKQLLKVVAETLSHYQLDYRSWDLKYPDTDRAKTWAADFDRQLASGSVPAFSFIYLPNDHTAGTNKDYPSPTAMVANNDEALGQVVDKISHSKVWGDSAIFVTEDDAQNGPDHVDGHRTVGLVVSPFVKHGQVDHTHYDQVSMMRTMELILNLPPLSLQDASALPMYDLFTAERQEGSHQRLAVDPQALKQAAKPADAQRLQQESGQLDLSKPDVGSQDEALNRILWESIKGTPYPAPAQSAQD